MFFRKNCNYHKEDTLPLVGRDVEIKDFLDELTGMNNHEQPKILVYNGAQGIGKSRLCLQFIEIVKNQKKKYVHIDFSKGMIKDDFEFFSRLFEQLNEKGIVLGETKKHLDYISDKINVTKNNKQNMLIPAADLLFLGTFSLGFISLLYGVSKGFMNRDITASHKEKSLGQSIDTLFYSWKEDIEKVCKKDIASPLVIFIDLDQSHNNNWLPRIKKLALQSPGVMWVLFCDDDFYWKHSQEDVVKKCTRIILLEKLLENHCAELLKRKNITNVELQNKVFELSVGKPELIKLLIDYILERDIEKVSDLNVANILSYYLSEARRDEQALLQILAVVRSWDQELLRSIMSHFSTGFPITEIDKLYNYSFIKKRDKQNEWYILDIFGQELLKRYSKTDYLKYDIHYFLSGYYCTALQQSLNNNNELILQKKSTIAPHEAFEEALEHSLVLVEGQIIHEDEFISWLEKTVSLMSERCPSSDLILVANKYVKAMNKLSQKNIPPKLNAYIYKGKAMRLVRNYKGALEVYAEALSLIKKTKDTYKETIQLHLDIARFYLEIYYDGEAVAATLVKAEEELTKLIDTKTTDESVLIFLWLELGELMYSAKMYEESIKYLEKVTNTLEESETTNLILAETYYHLTNAHIFSILNDKKGFCEKKESLAKECIDKAYELVKKCSDSPEKNFLHAKILNNIGNSLRKSKNESDKPEAEIKYEQALKLLTEEPRTNYEKHQKARTHINLAKLYLSWTEKFHEANSHFEKALKTIGNKNTSSWDENLKKEIQKKRCKHNLIDCSKEISTKPIVTEKESPIVGALMGLAVGDALGTPIEGVEKTVLDRIPINTMIQGEFPLGTWSDDTSLTFCLVKNIIEKGYCIEHLKDLYLKWYNEGEMTATGYAFSVGDTIKKALEKLNNGINPLESGDKAEKSNGNGSLMRILPASIYFSKSKDMCHFIQQNSSITHAHQISNLACLLYSFMVKALLAGKQKSEAYYYMIEEANKLKSEEKFSTEWVHFDHILTGSILDGNKKISAGSYVVLTLEAALWAFMKTDTYKDCMLKVINLGGDTDTVAAIAGGLAGLHYGYSEIPEEWTQSLQKSHMLLNMSKDFAKKCFDTNFYSVEN
ncbi:ADP-ribosylglycohydrolase family protein [Heliorestis acidaminivorans]|nr:ADP-ribosylglycohydrolase family protein [Heliorestis acidaminivorans]